MAIRARYLQPVPGGTVGRTDQGVDISASPGTPIRAIANEQAVGIIPNWYQGQPFEWFRVLGTNTYNYVAEQVTRLVRPGTIVRAGQPVGYVAPSGTGLELGWATRGGQTLARATTGYAEGQTTPAGSAYRQQVIQGGAAASAGAAGGSRQQTLAQLWIQAGGDPALANTMAAIAMAESSGRLDSVSGPNSNGTVDRGPWQINSSHTQFNAQQLTSDPLYSARAAVAIEKSQGLTAWTTYNTGAYRQFLGGASKATVNYGGPNGGIVRPGGASATGDPGGILDKYVSLRDTPRTAPTTKNPFAWWLNSFTGRWKDANS